MSLTNVLGSLPHRAEVLHEEAGITSFFTEPALSPLVPISHILQALAGACQTLRSRVHPSPDTGFSHLQLRTFSASCFCSLPAVQVLPHSRSFGRSFYSQVRSDFACPLHGTGWHEVCLSCLLFHPLWTLTSLRQGTQQLLHYVMVSLSIFTVLLLH